MNKFIFVFVLFSAYAHKICKEFPSFSFNKLDLELDGESAIVIKSIDESEKSTVEVEYEDGSVNISLKGSVLCVACKKTTKEKITISMPKNKMMDIAAGKCSVVIANHAADVKIKAGIIKAEISDLLANLKVDAGVGKLCIVVNKAHDKRNIIVNLGAGSVVLKSRVPVKDMLSPAIAVASDAQALLTISGAVSCGSVKIKKL